MSLTLVYKGPAERGKCWQQAVADTLPEIRWFTWPDVPDPQAVDAFITWTLPKDYQTQFPNLKAIFCVGAGVDQLAPASLSPGIRLVRMLDPSIATQMQSYVLSAVMMIHREQFRYLRQAAQSLWQPHPVKLPHECTVTILGLGTLGSSVALMLQQLGFSVQGWSRSPKTIDGVSTTHGREGLNTLLPNTDILISLLPLTDDTKGILDYDLMSRLPKDAALVNVGRGEQLVNNDLLQLLDSGHLSQAVLDVFDQEPLPTDHPFWAHPNVHVTPHIASVTRNDTAALRLVENLKLWIQDEPMVGEVNKGRGY
ncbi:2-hydroxyacid dehydrogenase [Paraglaciecola chathamensis]|uniref:Glyoxylate/hydroxypyruvate reductase A n=1 Tax=Paraglaciecola chathamensis S18K6 TaxID=1127672 RepID=A0AAV3UTB3_9ALTE|nr:glyoxylate/hydroxypyruvate reductase A [Paraglaciecola chathamensis]GAC08302.1 glyoxylate/hydroxypyruvate reductase A [Paraglaciecola chathamensis S18K6]